MARIDMVGKRFGRLVGVRFVGVICGRDTWIFQCDCGQQREIIGKSVRRGLTRSCGCLRREMSSARVKTHGMSHGVEHNAWSSIRNRCYNSAFRDFKYYGGRGIVMCDEWRNSFEAFYRDMGPRPSPGLTIERKDNDLGYSKKNCVWATRTEQSRNRRSIVMSAALALEVRAVKACGGNIAEWARNHSVSREVASLAANGTTWKGL